MTVPLMLRAEPFTEPAPIELPEGIVTVTEFAESITAADLPSIFDAGFTALAAARPIGPGYAIYSGPPTGWFDVEIGFPIAPADAEAAHAAGFTVSTFPAGRALALSHLGAYDGLGESWGALMTHLADQELGEPKLIAEIYLTDPSATAAESLRTDLLVLY